MQSRQNLRVLQEQRDRGVKYVLILSGDQLYRMDYELFLKTHLDSGAHATIGCLPVDAEQARSFGIMRLDASGRVTGFLEKPKNAEERELIRTEASWIDSLGLESKGREYLASMGIYVFNMDTLLDVLTKTNYHDFGKEIFPAAIRTRHVQAHLFDGYWEDIGTIKAFYECNLQLAGPNPPFEFVSQGEPIFSRARFLPPTRFEGSDDPQQPGRRRLLDRRGIGHRKQRDRASLADRAERDDPRHDPHGRGLLHRPARPRCGRRRRTADRRDRRRIIDRDRDRRQELPHRRNVTVHNRSQRETSDECAWGLISDGIIIFSKGAELPRPATRRRKYLPCSRQPSSDVALRGFGAFGRCTGRASSG